MIVVIINFVKTCLSDLLFLQILLSGCSTALCWFPWHTFLTCNKFSPPKGLVGYSFGRRNDAGVYLSGGGSVLTGSPGVDLLAVTHSLWGACVPCVGSL